MSKVFIFDSGNLTLPVSSGSPATALSANRNKGGLVQLNFYMTTLAITQIATGSVFIWIRWIDNVSGTVQDRNMGSVRTSEIQNSQITLPINTRAGTPIQYYTDYVASLATPPWSIRFQIFGENL